MARTSSIPAYRLHKPSGQAVVTLRIDGIRRDVYLGRFNSVESRREYGRLLAESAARPSIPPVARAAPAGPTLAEVMVAYMHFALGHYRRADGTHTSEIEEIKRSLRPLRRFYETTPASEFGPLALAAVRRSMMERPPGATDDRPVLSRPVINRRIDRIKRMFRWAASQELVPVTVFESLRTLAGLQRGRTTAPEPPPVKPVDPADVAKTLPFLGPHLRAMVELQRVTGMRPGEVCSMKLSEIDTTTEPWSYHPAHHKTLHHGRDRVIMIGPRGRAVIEGFLAASPVLSNNHPLFSPRRAREERFLSMRTKRKTPVQPSQLNRRLRAPKLSPKDMYSPHAYAHAVRVAAKKAGAGHWHPNQLRHLYASEVRRQHGLEAAQVLLGHSSADITQIYAERDLALAARIALRVG